SRPLKRLHPSAAKVSFIWQTYLDVIDPLVKVFHIPSVQRYIMSTIEGREAVDPCTNCVVFAIYYATAISLSAAECRHELEEERPVLLQRYREGLELSLDAADLSTSQDIIVLQAFVLYLVISLDQSI
ncbi:hypothetical protein BBK36DRAFT_1120000, partial [Trichoderma citrinoviride]